MSPVFPALAWYWGIVWWNSPLLCRQTWDDLVNSSPSPLQSLQTLPSWLSSPVPSLSRPHQWPSRLSSMMSPVSSMTLKLLLVLLIPVMILEAAPLGQGDSDTQLQLLEVIEQIRKVSASLRTSESAAAAKVDVYNHLVSTVPEKSRLKVSRRILRKLLHIRDRTMMLRWWNIRYFNRKQRSFQSGAKHF